MHFKLGRVKKKNPVRLTKTEGLLIFKIFKANYHLFDLSFKILQLTQHSLSVQLQEARLSTSGLRFRHIN